MYINAIFFIFGCFSEFFWEHVFNLFLIFFGNFYIFKFFW